MNVLTPQIEASTVSKQTEAYQKSLLHPIENDWIHGHLLATVGTNEIIQDMIFPNIMFLIFLSKYWLDGYWVKI